MAPGRADFSMRSATRCGSRLNRIQTPHRPANERQRAAGERGMHKGIFHSGRRTEKERGTFRCGPQSLRAAVDFISDFARAGAPERTSRMRLRVIGEGMTARENFGDEMRMFLRPRAHNEEGGARIELLEEIEQSYRVRGRRSVIDRDPDFALGRGEGRHDRSPPLAIRHQRRVEQEQVRNEERREREIQICPDEREREQRSDDCAADEQRSSHARLFGRRIDRIGDDENGGGEQIQ